MHLGFAPEEEALRGEGHNQRPGGGDESKLAEGDPRPSKRPKDGPGHAGLKDKGDNPRADKKK